MSGKRLLCRSVVLLAVSASVGCGGDKKTEEGRTALAQRVAQQLQVAKAKADAYDFDGANAILRDLPEEVNKSLFADVTTYDKLTADVDAARRSVSEKESEYQKKIRGGWKVIDGHLVSPADQQRALAEKKRRDEAETARREAEQARLMAEAKAKAESEAREQERRRAEVQALEDQARQARERENAQRKLAESIRGLPTLQTALDGQPYRSAQLEWLGWSIRMRSASLDEESREDPNECLMAKPEVIRRIRATDARGSPVLLSYRDEILDIVENLEWAAYIITPEASQTGDIPIRFAIYQSQPVLMLGAVFSDTVFNNVNQAMNTPKKRAAAFLQREILPTLLKTRLSDRLKAAQFGYVGLFFVYGNRNFVRDYDSPSPESLCVILSTRDFTAFVNRELSQEGLVKNSAIFLASEGPQFMRVELTLE